MAVLDNLVNQAKAVSGSEADLFQLLKALKQSESTLKHQASNQHGAALIAAAARLDVAQHSLACLYFL